MSKTSGINTIATQASFKSFERERPGRVSFKMVIKNRTPVSSNVINRSGGMKGASSLVGKVYTLIPRYNKYPKANRTSLVREDQAFAWVCGIGALEAFIRSSKGAPP